MPKPYKIDGDDPCFVVYAHGHNGDFQFTEPWTVTDTLAEARTTAERVMQFDRHRYVHNGKPTITWMEIFGPGIEESIGLEERDGTLVWTP